GLLGIIRGQYGPGTPVVGRHEVQRQVPRLRLEVNEPLTRFRPTQRPDLVPVLAQHREPGSALALPDDAVLSAVFGWVFREGILPATSPLALVVQASRDEEGFGEFWRQGKPLRQEPRLRFHPLLVLVELLLPFRDRAADLGVGRCVLPTLHDDLFDGLALRPDHERKDRLLAPPLLGSTRPRRAAFGDPLVIRLACCGPDSERKDSRGTQIQGIGVLGRVDALVQQAAGEAAQTYVHEERRA